MQHSLRRENDIDTIIKASGPGPSWAEIKRICDQMSNNDTLLSETQQAAYEQAVNHVKQNSIEAARSVLETTFEWVKVEQQ
ncbi:MAG: hypothetical protein PVS3B3_30780 [Ktedonobacteraceae bacterium]